MPELNRLVEKYKQNTSVLFLAPSFEEKPMLQNFLTRHPFKYEVLSESTAFNKSLNNLTAYPVNMIIDKNGVIKEVFVQSRKDIFSLMDSKIQENL